MKAFSRIFHASDFSPASRRAFAEALRLARTSHAELIIGHVLAPPAPIAADGFVAAQAYEAMEGAARQAAKAGLARLLRRAKAAHVRARALLLRGAPHDQIVRSARRHRANLVVVGTHGRSGLPRLLLGSVAARVVALAPCPVLTVRGR